MNIVKFWFKNARPQSLPQSVFPAVLAVCLASSNDDFSLLLGVLGVLGVIMGHLGLNLFDDYFDYKKKDASYRDRMAHEGFRARIGKCLYLTNGQTTVKSLLFVCCIFCALALLCGAVIWYFRGESILYIAVITAVLGISYSGMPLRLSYHGLGEILIGIIFGPLVMMGTFYAACGLINLTVLFISIPVGLLVTNIVYVHAILDFEPDKKIGKHTLAVLLNNKKAMLLVLSVILFTPYLLISYAVFMSYVSSYYLLLIITLPMAVSLFAMMVKFVKNPHYRFSPRIWMGPMAHWDRLQIAGIDWFMIRWYLARNLLSAFCLIVLVLSLIE
ncbi:prenyltransferase [Dysgonomonas sp. 216]|uniref:prenyltransferase n=1 Tax=Dysgonomonas sp. 216 TaxID=2302934 RepID=UPI0013D6C30F|nr:prenyltransferase [Dysgonomonas sp. 216]NDW17842.1 prenyltransferase [Dysgonomonas sp. 216]